MDPISREQAQSPWISRRIWGRIPGREIRAPRIRSRGNRLLDPSQSESVDFDGRPALICRRRRRSRAPAGCESRDGFQGARHGAPGPPHPSRRGPGDDGARPTRGALRVLAARTCAARENRHSESGRSPACASCVSAQHL